MVTSVSALSGVLARRAGHRVARLTHRATRAFKGHREEVAVVGRPAVSVSRVSGEADIPKIHPGLSAEVEITVGEADTALAHGSGDVEVLATPKVIGLCEAAAVKSVASLVSPARTTVGMRVQVDHLAPSAVGARVIAEAVLERIEGRRLIFTVTVNDSRGLVAAGKVTRVIVEREKFLAKASH